MTPNLGDVIVPLTNVPRDYAWGSRTLIAHLEGRETAEGPEAEVWFGDHPSDPSDLADGSGRTLDSWLETSGIGRLPYLMKLLAAARPLSIQVHPSKSQAEAGFAREAALPASTPRNYIDDNHKPELLVALSQRFESLCGLRPLDATRRLVDALGDGVGPRALRARLEGDVSLGEVIRWLLSREAADEVDSIIAALADAQSIEFAAELANARRVAAVYPRDAGVIVALLMNYVVLRRGEAVFLRAGMLHAYVAGLGVELMAASDNVLRGGLTGKHVDVDELLAILDTTPGAVPVVLPVAASNGSRGIECFPAPTADFELLRAAPYAGAPSVAQLRGPAIALVTSGTVRVGAGTAEVELTPGRAALITPDDPEVRLSGDGEIFIAQPGRDTP